uniref:Uncharacterized protein n=1 Tax=Eptatretus burgeri TaxID=7764 RepID=A0A8C4NAP8_EPTBU
MDVRKLVEGALVSCVRLREVVSLEAKDQGAWNCNVRGKEVRDSFGWGQLLLTGEVVNFMHCGTALHAEPLLLTRVAAWLEERRHSINSGSAAGKMLLDHHSFIMECIATYSPCEQCVDCIKEFRSKTGVRVILRCCRLYELNPRHPSPSKVSLAELGRDFSLLSPEKMGHLLKQWSVGRHRLDQVPSSMLRGYTAYALSLQKMLKRMRINTVGQVEHHKCEDVDNNELNLNKCSVSNVRAKRVRIEEFCASLTPLPPILAPHIPGHFAVSPCLCRGNCLRCCPCRQSHRHCTPLCGGHRVTCQSQQHDS